MSSRTSYLPSFPDSLGDDLDEGTIRKLFRAKEVDGSVSNEAPEHGWEFRVCGGGSYGVWGRDGPGEFDSGLGSQDDGHVGASRWAFGRRFKLNRCRWGGGGLRGVRDGAKWKGLHTALDGEAWIGFRHERASFDGGCSAVHAAVHGLVCEAVGGFVFVAKRVRNLEVVKFRDAAFCFLPERDEVGGFHLVGALDLLDHQQRVGDDPECGVAVIEGILQGGEKAGVFGKVIRADAQELG